MHQVPIISPSMHRPFKAAIREATYRRLPRRISNPIRKNVPDHRVIGHVLGKGDDVTNVSRHREFRGRIVQQRYALHLLYAWSRALVSHIARMIQWKVNRRTANTSLRVSSSERSRTPIPRKTTAYNMLSRCLYDYFDSRNVRAISFRIRFRKHPHEQSAKRIVTGFFQ